MTWNYAYTPHIWPSFLTVIFLIALSVYSWRRRSVPGALLFAIGCLLAALWAAGSFMEVAALDVTTKILWLKFQAFWQLPAITAVTCFILEYVWPGRWLTRRNLVLLSIAPLLEVILILTNNLNHWMWHGFSYDGRVIPLHGPVYWIFIAYAFGLFLIEILTFTWLFLHSPQHRWPVAIMLTGQIVSRTVYVLEAVNIVYVDQPLDVVAIAIVFLMYAGALFSFRIFDPIPLARRTAIEQMQAGLLVLDPKGRVASLNPSAERILQVPASRARGQPISELLPAYLDGHIAASDEIETEFSLGAGQEVRHYTLSISLLKDWRELEVGRLLLIRDVTGQKQAHAQVIEQQRALAMLHEREQLARELHDSIGQVFAFVNAQGQTVQRLLGRGDIKSAEAHIGRLVEVAREADTDIRESILGLRVTLAEQGFYQALAQYLVRYEKNYGIHTEFVKPETFTDGSFEPLVEVQLLRILQEALTNVRKHAHANCVWIEFAHEGGWARVTVQDDGHGFSPGSSEDGLGEHVGMRVMRERAEEVGGNLNLYSEAGQGTRVVVRVPIKKEESDHA